MFVGGLLYQEQKACKAGSRFLLMQRLILAEVNRMAKYEIRILDNNMKLFSTAHINSDGHQDAVQAGIARAKGRAVEVWKGSLCVYRSSGLDGSKKASPRRHE